MGVAAAEAGAGLRGSRVLLAEALRAMRLLLRCVGGADDLALKVAKPVFGIKVLFEDPDQICFSPYGFRFICSLSSHHL